MKTLIAMICLLAFSVGSAATTITYQGQLQDASGPYTGTPGMEFRLFDSLTGGSQIGATTVLSAVPVTDGLFQVELDFGAAYAAGPLYLEIMVSGKTLAPRQRIASAPLAVAALNVPEVSLAELACSTSEVPRWNGTAWTCASSASAEDLQAERDRIDALETENAALTSQVDDLETMVNGMATQLAALTSVSEDHDSRLVTIENSELLALEDFVVDLDEFLELHRTSPGDTAVHGPIMRLTGANLQIINAAQDQTTPDGTGNLVVGFATERTGLVDVCSNPSWDNQGDCEGGGHIWARGHNSGSHNIVGGENAAYSRTGGIVLGDNNAITQTRAAAIAGRYHVVRGVGGSITGGQSNRVTHSNSSVSGGQHNTASSFYSSVSGGQYNTASGPSSSISGGLNNTANDWYSSVSGGWGNTASGNRSSISGGQNNIASGSYSSVSGGSGCVVDLSNGWGAKDLVDCQ